MSKFKESLLLGLEARFSTYASSASSVFAADVDGDGDLDVLSASSDDNKIAWYENRGGGSFTAGEEHVISHNAGDASSDVFAADVDGDGDLDVLSASWGDGKIAWYENRGGGSFAAGEAQHLISHNASRARSVFAADVDGDGDLDVLSASEGDNKIAWYENRSFRKVQPVNLLSVSQLSAAPSFHSGFATSAVSVLHLDRTVELGGTLEFSRPSGTSQRAALLVPHPNGTVIDCSGVTGDCIRVVGAQRRSLVAAGGGPLVITSAQGRCIDIVDSPGFHVQPSGSLVPCLPESWPCGGIPLSAPSPTLELVRCAGGGISMTNSNGCNMHRASVRDSGVGIELSGSRDVAMVEAALRNCTQTAAGAGGGGIRAVDSRRTRLVHVTVEDCHARSGDGGGIHVSGGLGQLLAHNLTVQRCTSPARGGGVFLRASAPFPGPLYDLVSRISDSTITENEARDAGGGLFAELSVVSVAGGRLAGNSAGNSGGAAFFMQCTASLSGTAISDNNAAVGGGLFSDESRLSLRNCSVTGNEALSYGGGLALAYSPFSAIDAAPLLAHTTITGNKAVAAGGGGMAVLSRSAPFNITAMAALANGNSAAFGPDVAGVASVMQPSVPSISRPHTGEAIPFTVSVRDARGQPINDPTAVVQARQHDVDVSFVAPVDEHGTARLSLVLRGRRGGDSKLELRLLSGQSTFTLEVPVHHLLCGSNEAPNRAGVCLPRDDVHAVALLASVSTVLAVLAGTLALLYPRLDHTRARLVSWASAVWLLQAVAADALWLFSVPDSAPPALVVLLGVCLAVPLLLQLFVSARVLSVASSVAAAQSSLGVPLLGPGERRTLAPTDAASRRSCWTALLVVAGWLEPDMLLALSCHHVYRYRCTGRLLSHAASQLCEQWQPWVTHAQVWLLYGGTLVTTLLVYADLGYIPLGASWAVVASACGVVVATAKSVMRARYAGLVREPRDCSGAPLVFIGHSGHQKAQFAEPLYEMLQACGISAFLDKHSLTSGESFPREIARALHGCRVAVEIASPDFVSRGEVTRWQCGCPPVRYARRGYWPMLELNTVAQRRTSTVRVLPVYVNGLPPTVLNGPLRAVQGEVYNERAESNDHFLAHSVVPTVQRLLDLPELSGDEVLRRHFEVG